MAAGIQITQVQIIRVKFIVKAQRLCNTFLYNPVYSCIFKNLLQMKIIDIEGLDVVQRIAIFPFLCQQGVNLAPKNNVLASGVLLVFSNCVFCHSKIILGENQFPISLR